MVANDPSLLPYAIPLGDFVKLIYEPNQREDGIPLDALDFKMGTSVILSNLARDQILNVNDIPDSDLPPEILVNTIKYIPLDVKNDGSSQIDATVNIAAGHVLQTQLAGDQQRACYFRR